MIVLDASAVVELVLWTERGHRVGDAIARDRSLHVPELMVAEVGSVLRRLVAQGVVSEAMGADHLESVRQMPAEGYGHDVLMGRAFELCHNLTMYDAVYVALAESLAATLLTFDSRLAGAPGHRADIVVP